MAGITFAELDEYFKQLEWPFSKREDTLWDSGYVGRNFRVRFSVRLTERWVYINALLPAKVHSERRADLLEYLMRLNYRMNAAKFYLDDDDDITLAAEIPAENLQVGEFESALYAVTTNADSYFIKIMNKAVASDDDIAPTAVVPEVNEPDPVVEDKTEEKVWRTPPSS